MYTKKYDIHEYNKMEERRNAIFERARSEHKLVDEPAIFYSLPNNVKLVPIDVKEAETCKEVWKRALSKCIDIDIDDISDADLNSAHIGMTINYTDDLVFELDELKEICIQVSGKFTLYNEWRNNELYDMTYYINEAIVDDTPCFNLTRDVDNSITITHTHCYGFLADCDNLEVSFVYKNKIKAILCINPLRKNKITYTIPEYKICVDAECDDNVRDIFNAVKLRHDAYLYFNNMNEIYYEMMNRREEKACDESPTPSGETAPPCTEPCFDTEKTVHTESAENVSNNNTAPILESVAYSLIPETSNNEEPILEVN